MAGSNETKANSPHFQVKLPTGGELGNILTIANHATSIHAISKLIMLINAAEG